MVFQDLTGQKFGMLTVKYRIDDYIKPSGIKVPRWHCDCQCGGVKDITSDRLKKKNSTPSCGCFAHQNRVEKNRESFLGKKFHRLTIVEELFDYRPTKARCQCECGNLVIVDRADVVYGHTQSCGCLQKERASENNMKDWTGVISDYGVKFLKQDHMNNKGQWLWICQCGICDTEFVALPAKVNNGHITSCGCAVQSSGERYIASVLDEMQLEHTEQYIFADCKYKNQLKFDFAIFNHNKLFFLIEYDGKQHFEPIEWFGGIKGFQESQTRDEIKNQYCKNHNIPLLRLPYTFSNDEIKQQIYEYHLSLTTAGCA